MDIRTNAPAKNSENKELRVLDYFPNKTMTKQFSSSFENVGYKYIIDKSYEDKVQISKWIQE